ncbi:MAG TPA: glycosyltransferase family 4 protein [Saprospiraceae bacterium]|nr:glycosyltransferase family 4 protein [Saprospiraceae bacterium]HMP14782.1 glycosyltransferase family 4 protein [Saprospiraceae bacterium]
MAERIAVIIPYRFVPPTNGGQHAAFGFCTYLSHVRATLVVSSTDNSDTLPLPFRLERLFTPHPIKYVHPGVAMRLWRWLRQEQIRTVVVQQPFFGLLALPLCRFNQIKFIVYSHNIEYQRFRTLRKWWWPLLFPLEWCMYRIADRVLFISPDDRAAAIPIFGLKPNHCFTVPYGTNWQAPPTDRVEARQQVQARHGYAAEERLLLFFGPQSYRPNLEAVERIIEKINPLLLQYADFPYRILICGGGLPERYQQLANYKSQHVDYLGFVKEIDPYIKAADVVLNPIVSGGGVKTKIIEAIALGATVLSTETGAKGVDADACGPKLQLVPDDDDEAFAKTLLRLQHAENQDVPAGFYTMYHWAHIIEKCLQGGAF